AIQNILKKLDIVKLSLDSALQTSFKKLDRPFGNIDVGSLIECMTEFRAVHKQMLVLETLFVDAINDSWEDVDALKVAFKKIKPDRIDIGSIARPPAYGVKQISDNRLKEIQERLLPLPVFVATGNYTKHLGEYSQKEIELTLKKRPLVQDEVNALFDSDSKDRLENLIKKGLVEKKEFQGKIFYKSLDF
ncbi:MAG: radical SAM protein, partial [Campylobacterales bacterium]